MAAEPLVRCPICERDLPESAFGICRARSSGRNLYCKEDIRKKVSDQRKALKEYKAVRKQYQEPVFELESQSYSTKSLFKLSPVERVKDAIERGFRTQRDIRTETRLGADEIGDAIANLLLWTKEIRTQIVDGARLYFLNTVEEKPQINSVPVPFFEIARKLNAPVVKGEKSIRRVA